MRRTRAKRGGCGSDCPFGANMDPSEVAQQIAEAPNTTYLNKPWGTRSSQVRVFLVECHSSSALEEGIASLTDDGFRAYSSGCETNRTLSRCSFLYIIISAIVVA